MEKLEVNSRTFDYNRQANAINNNDVFNWIKTNQKESEKIPFRLITNEIMLALFGKESMKMNTENIADIRLWVLKYNGLKYDLFVGEKGGGTIYMENESLVEKTNEIISFIEELTKMANTVKLPPKEKKPAGFDMQKKWGES